VPGNSYESIKIGDSITIEKTITSEMVRAFSDFTGDLNPVHMDDEYCRQHSLGQRSVHGFLTMSFLSYIIGMHLPGKGSVCLSHNIDFLTPVRVGDTIRITGKVVAKTDENGLGLKIVTMKFTVEDQNGILNAKCTSKVSIK
jgi:3-hydroxybutyryl-CoA dehydratase